MPPARERLLVSWRKPETVLQFVVMVATVFFVFKGAGGEPSKFFYLLFLPLIWIALRGGFAGAAVASGVVQIGVVLAPKASRCIRWRWSSCKRSWPRFR